MGLFIFFACFLGVPSILFSVLSWRLKNNILFWLSVVFTGLLFAIYLFYALYIVSLFMHPDSFAYGVFLLLTVGIPIYFLISAKQKSTRYRDAETTDNTPGGPVTNEYLDSIINSPDEDLDFEK